MAASVSPARNNGHNTAIHFSRGVNSQLTAPPFPPSLRLTSQFNQVSKQNLCFQTEQLMRNRFTNFKEMHWNFFSEFTTHIAWNSKIKVGPCTIKKTCTLKYEVCVITWIFIKPVANETPAWIRLMQWRWKDEPCLS